MTENRFFHTYVIEKKTFGMTYEIHLVFSYIHVEVIKNMI